VRDPATALRQVCELVGVDPSFAFDTSVRYNPSSGAASAFGRLDRALRPAFPYLKRVLPSGLAGRLAARRAQLRAAYRDGQVVAMTDDVRADLTEHFRPDRAWLAREAAISFAGSPPAPPASW